MKYQIPNSENLHPAEAALCDKLIYALLMRKKYVHELSRARQLGVYLPGVEYESVPERDEITRQENRIELFEEIINELPNGDDLVEMCEKFVK